MHGTYYTQVVYYVTVLSGIYDFGTTQDVYYVIIML